MTSRTNAVEEPKPPEIERTEDNPLGLSEKERAMRRRFGQRLRALHGKLQLKIDIDELRGRNRG